MLWCRTLTEPGLYADPSCETALLRPGKALLLLAYLGLHPRRREHRDRLVELFWPSTPNGKGRHALRQTLYRLTLTAPGTTLIEGDEVVRLTGPIAFDCLEGERALAEGDFDRAADLLRGPFLPGLCALGCGDHAEWVEAQDSRFRAGFARAADAVIASASSAGDPLRAVRIAEELVVLNPIDDERVRRLMHALDRAGQARQALARYAEFTQRLRMDDGDEPPEDLRAYAEELQRSIEITPQESAAALPFVGRSEAWAALDRAWADVEAGSCVTVLVEGDAGLGKTRLVEEFRRRVIARGALGLGGKCYEMEAALPYALIGDVLRSAEPGADLPIAPPLASVPGNGDVLLREELVRWLDRAPEAHPVILVCDDVHWADEGSLQLLHALTHRLSGSRVLIICTYRPLELTTAARRFTMSLAGEHLARLVTLRPFRLEEVREILTTMGTFDATTFGLRLAEALHQHTEGNPLFLAELLAALASRGDLACQGGRWTTSRELDSAALPKTIKKILADRVDGLATRLRDVLEVVTAAADAVDAGVVAQALGISEPAAQAALSELGKSRLLRAERMGAWAAGHDELRQLVYASIPDQRRRRLHGAIGTALEAHGRHGPASAARLARHFEQAGDAARARLFALAAAGEAGALGAHESRKALTALADALYPASVRDVPPARSPSRSRLRQVATAAALLGGAALVTYAGLAAANGAVGRHPFALGTIFITEEERRPDGTPEASASRLEWPTRHGVAQLTPIAWPRELPPPLVMNLVQANQQTHGKIFRVVGGDAVQVTFGDTDDAPAIWSPDRRLIVVQKGWREGRSYRFNLFIVDTLGRDVWRVTDGHVHDGVLEWSPDGTRIAFQRTVDGERALWLVDPDGGHPENLTAAFQLPPPRYLTRTAFTSDGAQLAVLNDDDGTVHVLDLRRRSVRVLEPACVLRGETLAWSPDNRWLAVDCLSGGGTVLTLLPADGSGSPTPLLGLAPGTRVHWVGTTTRYVAGVKLHEDPVTTPPHRGRTVQAEAVDARGRPMAVDLRWSVGDSSIAGVDDQGFVRGRRLGVTWLAASAGGLYSDTASVIVTGGSVDTALAEDWANGIDPLRWEIVGDPPPEVIPGAGPAGAAAFLNNGDHNWPSGVLSVAEFDVSGGLTLEFSAQFRFTGDHWQELEAKLVPRERAIVAGERNAGAWTAGMWLAGPSFEYPIASYSCGSDTERGSEPFTPQPDAWHRFALQMRPDGRVECYVDGVLKQQTTLRTHAPRVSVYLGGRSQYTRILTGPMLVARGLLY
jgi:DNA-binding SARP family transcriptional activator